MSECKHEKVFANFILTSNPPQYPWVCKLCGETGVDQGLFQKNEYEEIMKYLNK